MNPPRAGGPRTGFEDVATELDAEPDAPADRPRVYLLARVGGASLVRELAEGGAVVVGRAPDADVVVDDARISRHHARLCRAGDEVLVEDLGSRNGTTVGGRAVGAGGVRAGGGDLVRVPGCELVVAIAAEPPPAGAAVSGAPALAAPADVIAADPAAAELFALARRVARSEAAVLVLGETGVGKDVVARQIHAWSARAAGPFVRVNCAALPEGLLESELFGHERGAFTGATHAKEGYFQTASGGTLFIDEVGEMPLAAQVKLLNVLENRSLVRVGGTREQPVDVRVVCATHRDPARLLAEGRFREDLYYRISTFALRVPPLRERPSDVAPLAALFARRFSPRPGPPARFTDAALAALARHDWPGNVRELRNAVEHALVLAEGAPVGPEHLPPGVRDGRRPAPPARPAPPGRAAPMRDRLLELERAGIEEALEAEGGNRTRAAKRLGMPRRTLVHKLGKLGINRGPDDPEGA